MKRIYLDYTATTPMIPEVQEAMMPFYGERFGNPSSLHYHGQQARAAIDNARAGLARSMGAEPDEIIFTSGGSESNNTAIKGIAWAANNKKRHIITSAIEHHAVLEPCHFLQKNGFSVTILPVDQYGFIDPDDVKKAITGDTCLVSIMHANNEIGTIEPIKDIGRICRQKGVCMHTDAVQSFGSLDIDVNELEIDMLSISAHKIYGPKGSGALYVRKGTRITPLIHGGGQEGGRRASTQNTAGIVGLARAADIAMTERDMRVRKYRMLRDRIIEGVQTTIEDAILNGHPTDRLPNNCHFIVKHIEGEALLLKLNNIGIEAATGSACSSGSLEASHVLIAIGISPVDAQGSLRFSVGHYTEMKDIEYLLEHLPKIVHELRHISPLSRKKNKLAQ